VGVLVLSFLPSELADSVRPHIWNSIDIGHLLAYALLAGTTMLSVPRQTLTLSRGAGIAIKIGLLGLAIELLQPLAERTTSIIDFTENVVGIVCGMAILYGYFFFSKRSAARGPVCTVN
jgi:hypothetical protein